MHTLQQTNKSAVAFAERERKREREREREREKKKKILKHISLQMFFLDADVTGTKRVMRKHGGQNNHSQ